MLPALVQRLQALGERLERGELDLAMVARLQPPKDMESVTLYEDHDAVGSFGQIVHLLGHSDHAAVLGSRVAATYGERLRVLPLPFGLPRYRALLCWAARACKDPGIAWLKDEILRIAAAA